MVHPVAQLQHEGRGARIDPTGLTARYRRAGQPRAEVRPDAMRGGLRAFADGDLELVIERQDHGSAATLNAHLVNRGAAPLDVESIEFAFEFRGHGHDDLRFLRHGWQSWSPTAVRVLDDAGEPPFPSGPWLRGMYHSQGESRPGVHESETLTAVGGMAGGPFCLVGVLESGRGFGLVRLAPSASDGGERPVVVEVELGLEISLAPGERRDLESIRLALGPEPNALLEQFAELWGSVAGARRAAPFQAGWCSWYHFFHAVSEEAMLRNIDALAADRSGIPVEVVQLDDGFQPAMGDWLAPSARFPGGPRRIAEAIRQAGFRAGIWTAPFAASAESEVLSAHPDWALDDEGSPLRGTYNPEWSRDGWVYVLDPSRPEVAAHLEATFAALVEMGFDYLKLDFLFMPAMRGRGADPSLTRAQRLARGLEAIRRGAGEDAFLLGCGCPLGPAVGRVDGMRIGPDVAPAWAVEQPVAIPGLEEMLPSTRMALRSILARQFLHRRLWLNDPDCLMVRSRETRLSAVETASLAAGVALSGEWSSVPTTFRSWSRGNAESSHGWSNWHPASMQRAVGGRPGSPGPGGRESPGWWNPGRGGMPGWPPSTSRTNPRRLPFPGVRSSRPPTRGRKFCTRASTHRRPPQGRLAFALPPMPARFFGPRAREGQPSSVISMAPFPSAMSGAPWPGNTCRKRAPPCKTLRGGRTRGLGVRAGTLRRVRFRPGQARRVPGPDRTRFGGAGFVGVV